MNARYTRNSLVIFMFCKNDNQKHECEKVRLETCLLTFRVNVCGRGLSYNEMSNNDLKKNFN
jgi:hypothetical protein